MNNRFVLLSGCSGGGKTSLLGELRKRGYHTVEEPGRRIVQQELATGGTAVPWLDLESFARRAIEMAQADRLKAEALPGLVFFDRGLVDAASALEAITKKPAPKTLNLTGRYHRLVFLTPPWPEIFTADPERCHDFEAALLEYHRLEKAFPALGYETVLLPRISLSARGDFVLTTLSRTLINFTQADSFRPALQDFTDSRSPHPSSAWPRRSSPER